MKRSCLSLILAAGDGKRMISNKPKVLHEIANFPLLGHVLDQVIHSNSDRIAVITGDKSTEIKAKISPLFPQVEFVVQQDRLGTAHAVLTGLKQISQQFDDLIIAFGDTPLILAKELLDARFMLQQGADIVIFGFYTEQPEGYGRLICQGGSLLKIVEDKDTNNEQKKIKLCNGGLMVINGHTVPNLIKLIDNNNVQKEYYLTDLVEIAVEKKLNVKVLTVPQEHVLGVNNRQELAKVERLWQQKKRQYFLKNGITLQDPETVFFSYDTIIEPDVFIEPQVIIGPNVIIEKESRIRAFSYLEGTKIANNATIGPFARLRPHSQIGPFVKVGNFCEIKNSNLERNVKVNHLSYIGDTHIGERTNVGAGTVTCNYDGYHKWPTIIGEESFIGSNSALVAPVTIGKNTIIAAGSTITENVGDDALAIARSRQINKINGSLNFKKKINEKNKF